jgi:kynureninase
MNAPSLEEARAWDKQDRLRDVRNEFALPEGVIYLDGNSLGPLTHAATARVKQTVLEEWGNGLIGSWHAAGWMEAPARVGAKIAPLLGAAADEVILADSTSVNLFKLAGAALGLVPGRSTLLTEEGNFPTDRHVLEGLARLLPGLQLVAVPADRLAEALDAHTAVLLLCHVNYRSGARHDMAALSAAARRVGAISIWDLSHSVGAIPVALNAAGADMAVGCGYKFLNGGPGAPAFLYVARRLQQQLRSPVQGWFGHAAPFGFSDRYEPASGIRRFLSGTPGVLGLAALEAGVEVFTKADPTELWTKSARLFDLFAALARENCPELTLITPAEPGLRGSHIAFRHNNAETVMRALITQGVIGDFRPPDLLRFGLTPLYVGCEDVWRAVEILRGVVAG